MSPAELRRLLHGAFSAAARRVGDAHEPGDVYAFVAYPTEGFYDVGLAYATRASLGRVLVKAGKLNEKLLAMLQEHPDLLATYGSGQDSAAFEVQACDWEYCSAFPDLFRPVNAFIERELDDLSEPGRSALFERVLVDIWQSLKRDGVFDAEVFEDDVLLGVQFPTPVDIPLMLRVSAQLNSPEWHAKLDKALAAST